MEDGDLEDIFTEELGSDDIEVVAVEDDVVDNLEDEADDSDQTDDEIESDDETDTDDEPPVEDSDDFDWNGIVERYGERTVEVTVQGERVTVPLKDLPDGFMRREDYSRKTAEVSQVRKAAQWAQDIQESFSRDPQGTLEAFARAYNIGVGAPEPEQGPDPYEDFDPEVAQVLRQRDELLAQQQQQLEALSSRYESAEHEKMMAEVKAEVAVLKDEFGDELDHVEMLRVAANHNMPLREAAEYLVGRTAYAKSREQLEAEAAAAAAGSKRVGKERSTAKKRASSTNTKRYDASDVSVDDFSDIGELFEITANSMTT